MEAHNEYMGAHGLRKQLKKSDLSFSIWATSFDDNADEFVCIAPQLAIRPNYTVEAVEDMLRLAATLHMKYDSKEHRPILRDCTFRSGYDELKVSDIHKIPIEGIIRTFQPDLYGIDGEECYGPLPEWKEMIRKPNLKKMGAKGPNTLNLVWTARIYYVALLHRLPPTKRVSESFGLPLRTASNWVKLMKDRIQSDSWPQQIDFPKVYTSLCLCPAADAAQRFFDADQKGYNYGLDS